MCRDKWCNICMDRCLHCPSKRGSPHELNGPGPQLHVQRQAAMQTHICHGPSQLVRIRMHGCKVWGSPNRYVNVVFQLSSLIPMRMAGGGGEKINLIGWSYQANEKSSGLTFHMDLDVSARIKEQRRQELHFVATVSEAKSTAHVFAHSSTLWESKSLHPFAEDQRGRAPAKRHIN